MTRELVGVAVAADEEHVVHGLAVAAAISGTYDALPLAGLPQCERSASVAFTARRAAGNLADTWR